MVSFIPLAEHVCLEVSAPFQAEFCAFKSTCIEFPIYDLRKRIVTVPVGIQALSLTFSLVYHHQLRGQNASSMPHTRIGVSLLSIRASAAPRSPDIKRACHHTRSTISSGLANLLP